jgi:hypothetical protein
MKRTAFAVALSVCAWASQGQAAEVTFTFTGIEHGTTSLTPTIQDGQTVTGTFSWNTSAVPIIENLGGLGSYAYYPGQATMITIGSYSFNFSGFSTTGALVFEDLTGTTGYRIDDENHPPGGGLDGIFDLRLYSSNASLVTSYALPSRLPELMNFDEGVDLFYGIAGTDLASIDVTDIEPVSEPGMLSLLSIPLAAFAVLRRRNQI